MTPPTSKRIVLFTACITLFFLTYMFSSVNIVLPAISAEFKADAILLSWVSTAGILSTGVLLLPIGRLSDIFGIKKMFTLGLILYIFLVVTSAFATSVPMLIALRAITGISSAMAVGNAVAMVAASFPPGERGRALGLTSASVYAGLSAGPFLGGLLSEHFGWRSTFLANVPCITFVVILVLWKIKSEWRSSKGEGFDISGTTIFCLSLFALLYGFSILPGIPGAVLVPAGIIGLVLFTRWEMRAASPVLNLVLFRNNRTFILSNLAAFASYAATYAVVFLMSLYLQYVKGMSAETAGLVLMAQPAIQAVLSPLAGRLSDKMEPRIVSSIGMAVTCAGLAILALLRAESPLIAVIGGLLVLGIGFALFVAPNTNAIMSSIPTRYYGVGSAVSNTMRQTGQMFSMGVSMIVMSVFVGRVVITPEYYPALVNAMRVAFVVFAVLCFGGIFASLSRGKVH